MKTYQFESTIKENGIIILPKNMKNLKKHRVKLTVVDLEPIQNDPIDMLEDITQQYSMISNEDDLDISELYKQRETHHDREFVFD